MRVTSLPAKKQFCQFWQSLIRERNELTRSGLRGVLSDVTLDLDVGFLSENVRGVGSSRSELTVGAVTLDLHYKRGSRVGEKGRMPRGRGEARRRGRWARRGKEADSKGERSANEFQRGFEDPLQFPLPPLLLVVFHVGYAPPSGQQQSLVEFDESDRTFRSLNFDSTSSSSTADSLSELEFLLIVYSNLPMRSRRRSKSMTLKWRRDRDGEGRLTRIIDVLSRDAASSAEALSRV